MEIKDIFILSSVNKDTRIKCYDGKGSIAKSLFEGTITDLKFMSEHGHKYVVGFGKFDAEENSLEVFIRID